MAAPQIAARALPILERLVGFDTTSHRSNLALIEWVESYLAEHGVASRRIPGEGGLKANLVASVGPAAEGGVVLSGHTDVVPVEGQPWTSDPFAVTRRSDRLYGRGVADMKSFLALALAAVPDLLAAPLKAPAHLALSYDEEIGCFGAPHMIAAIAADLPRPALAVVGEPTSMGVVSAHKGIVYVETVVTGHEAHSAQTHLGVSAVMAALPILTALGELARELEAGADPASPFTPKGASLTIGRLAGGTAGNILARECRFVFDLRCPPGVNPHAILAPIFELGRWIDGEIKAKAPGAGATMTLLADVPALAPEADGAAEAFVRRLTGDNDPAGAVSYAAEAGQFQQAGFSTVICGPGSIDQAHQPDEWIALAQIDRGAAFMARLVEALSEG
jgi:acetylornithine deacetylase